MKSQRRVIVFIVIFLLAAATAAKAVTYQSVLRVKDGKVIPFARMIDEIDRADIVFVGENHDNQMNHEAQLDVITALKKKRVPLAIGLEMFRADSQKELNSWTGGSSKPSSFMKVYYENWNLPWPLYSRIFLYSRDNRIPMIGLNVPETISRKVSSEGFDSLSQAELKQLPPGISCDVDDSYRKFIRRAYEGHHGQGKAFVNFCEAQIVWDKSMAWHLMAYKKGNPGATVVVLAGAGHSWKHGIPAQIRKASSFSTVSILPDVPGKEHFTKAAFEDADYILLD